MSIFIVNVVLTIGVVIMMIENVYAIMLGRFIFGLACGAFSVFVPKFSKNTQSLVNISSL